MPGLPEAAGERNGGVAGIGHGPVLGQRGGGGKGRIIRRLTRRAGEAGCAGALEIDDRLRRGRAGGLAVTVAVAAVVYFAAAKLFRVGEANDAVDMVMRRLKR